MIELFSRRLDELPLGDEAQLTPLPVGEATASLSAILMDEDYYDFVLRGRRQDGGLAWIEAERLIPLKASAWLDLSARLAGGEKVDRSDVRKHINDVFRLSQLLAADVRIELPGKVAGQFEEFLLRAAAEAIDLKQLGVIGPGYAGIIARLAAIYGIAESPS